MEEDGVWGESFGTEEGYGEGAKRSSRRKRFGWIKWVLIAVGIVCIVFVALGFYKVDQTEMAVIKEFGRFVGTEGPGLHWRNPITQSVEIYYVGVRTVDFLSKEELGTAQAQTKGKEISRYLYPSIVVLSKDALEITIDLSVATSIKKDRLKEIATTFKNQEYLEQWKIATIRSAVRDVISQYNAEDIYGAKRSEVEANLHKELEKRLSKYFCVEGVYLRKVEPPERIKAAIEAKIQAQQEAQRMQFVLQKEKLEAERKQVEAEGIAKANQIIGESLRRNPEYIQWYYLQVLQKFAESQNNAIIIVPAPASFYPGVSPNATVPVPMIIPQQPAVAS